MPEDLTPEEWPLPTGRDELLRRVVAEGQRKLLVNRLLVAGATVAVAASLGTGLVLVGSNSGHDDAGRAISTVTEPSTDDEGPTSGPVVSSSTTGPTASTTPRPSDPTSPRPTTSRPANPSGPGSGPSGPVGEPPPPTTPGPSPTTGPPRPPTTEPPTPTTTSTTAPPPIVTVGPITRSPAAIVAQASGTTPCPGATTSRISAPVDNVTSATLSWEVGKTSGSKEMAITDGSVSATLGPFDERVVAEIPDPVTVAVTITVAGTGGEAHRKGTVTLIDCPDR